MSKKKIHPGYPTKFHVDGLIRDCKNLQETVRYLQAQKAMLARALYIPIEVPRTRAWLAANDPFTMRHINLALNAMRNGDSEIRSDVDWLFCDDCQSYHAVNNPTCFRLTGRKARVRR